jgi:hypothetical protein
MLLTENINIKLNKGNLGYYNRVMCGKFKIGDLIDVPIEKIPKSMYVDVKVLCDLCSSENITSYRNYNDCLSYGFYSCNKCKHIKRKMTNLKKHGVENYVNIEKRKETLYRENGFYNNGREKSKETCIVRYGVDNVSKIEDVKTKKIETTMKSWGVPNPTYIQSNNFISSIDGYIGYDMKEKLHNFSCNGHNYSIDTNLFYSRYYRGVETCTFCNKLNSVSSSYEDLIFEFIKSNYNETIIKSYRDKFEIDLYLPELKIGIEINGLYWHSNKFKEKNYHLNKTNYFKDKDIRIVHIWEDDIIFKIDLIKSMIINLLKKSNRIYARKCNISYIYDKNVVKSFLNKNHLQGYNNNIKFSIGLFYNGNLVSMMCFNDLEGRKRMKSSYNITRFCNLLNTSVVGGASKIIKRFIRDNKDIENIISYAEYSHSDGDLYRNMGFNEVNKNYPDYKYIIGNKRIHKSNLKKDKLGIKNLNITEKEFTEKNGIYRIYDCGKIKFIFNTKENI